MSFILSTQTQNFEPKPAGKFPARLIWLVDCGTQEVEYQGEKKLARKLHMTFETPENTKEFKSGEGEKPFVYSREFTASMHEKGNLRPFIEEWIGAGLTDSEAAGFDFEGLVNKPCEIKVMHKKNKDGSRTYTEIVRVEEIENCPKASNPIIVFSLPDKETADFTEGLKSFNQLPNWLKDKIKKSKEWIEFVEPFVNGQPKKPAKETMTTDEELPEIDVENMNIQMSF